MYALNRAQIIGHLTQAPEIRQTPTGQTVGDLNIVTRQTFLNASGQYQTSISFINVVVWRGLADICDRFLKQGSQVYIAGRIQTDEWSDPEGNKRYKTRVIADDMILVDAKTPYSALPQNSPIGGGLNQAEVIGNLTRDPEIRQTPNGESVCSFGVATNFAWKDRSGQDQEKTEFHNIVAWGQLAQSMAQSLRKGRKVYISGRLQTRSWDTPDGQKRWTTEIIADRSLALGTIDNEYAPQAGQVSHQIDVSQSATRVTLSEPVVKGSEEPASQQSSEPVSAGVIPQNPTSVPEVNYESGIKPEDLPF